MTKINGNKHYIQDEKIAELEHEYAETVDSIAAEVGDLIVVVDQDSGDDTPYANGDIGVALESDSDFEGMKVDFSAFEGTNGSVFDDGLWFVGYSFKGDYEVIRPTEAIRLNGIKYNVASTHASASSKESKNVSELLGLVSNLSRRVYEMERELATVHDNVEEFHEITETLHDDIVLLDNRTFEQPKVGDGYGR